MLGQAAVLFVFILSVHLNIWSKIQDPFLLSLAFIIAFISSDEPMIKYVKTVVEKEIQEKKS